MSDDVYQAIFHISQALEVPIVILALLSLALVLFELGAFLVELFTRRGRTFKRLAVASEEARRQIDKGDRSAAALSLSAIARGAAMNRALIAFVDVAGQDGAETRMAKELADFDFNRQRRLARTRLLVRVGPALGLMGTLIPLSPALDGLARGNVSALTENLRVAFSITVLGLLVGSIAFGISLYRDRMYGQDLSDLEYVAAVLTADAGHGDADPAEAPAVPSRVARRDGLQVHVPDPATDSAKDSLKDPSTAPVRSLEPGR